MSFILNFFSDINECETGTQDHMCDHICHNSVGSYTCSCESGFELVEMQRCFGRVLRLQNVPTHSLITLCIYTDVDECTEGVHMCEQVCENSVGSYQCSCFDGYILQNTFTCQGE